MRRRGFTLVELLVAIIVIAVIAAVSVPKFADRGLKARETVLKSDLRRIRTAVDAFLLDTGTYPDELASLSSPKAPAAGLDAKGKKVILDPTKWQGPYMEDLPNSPVTGIPFEYGTKPANIGQVSHPKGKATDGTNYADW